MKFKHTEKIFAENGKRVINPRGNDHKERYVFDNKDRTFIATSKGGKNLNDTPDIKIVKPLPYSGNRNGLKWGSGLVPYKFEHLALYDLFSHVTNAQDERIRVSIKAIDRKSVV